MYPVPPAPILNIKDPPAPTIAVSSALTPLVGDDIPIPIVPNPVLYPEP